jgi:hypothetical protein
MVRFSSDAGHRAALLAVGPAHPACARRLPELRHGVHEQRDQRFAHARNQQSERERARHREDRASDEISLLSATVETCSPAIAAVIASTGRVSDRRDAASACPTLAIPAAEQHGAPDVAHRAEREEVSMYEEAELIASRACMRRSTSAATAASAAVPSSSAATKQLHAAASSGNLVPRAGGQGKLRGVALHVVEEYATRLTDTAAASAPGALQRSPSAFGRLAALRQAPHCSARERPITDTSQLHRSAEATPGHVRMRSAYSCVLDLKAIGHADLRWSRP